MPSTCEPLEQRVPRRRQLARLAFDSNFLMRASALSRQFPRYVEDACGQHFDDFSTNVSQNEIVRIERVSYSVPDTWGAKISRRDDELLSAKRAGNRSDNLLNRWYFLAWCWQVSDTTFSWWSAKRLWYQTAVADILAILYQATCK